jgi:dTDP-glucose 4,6-dehydratase
MRQGNYLVIGGAGFIGSHVVDNLVAQGKNVLVLDNFVSGDKKNINPKAEWRKYDITSDWHILCDIIRNAGIDYVFHLAAEPYIPECYEYPEKFFEVNANGTLNVLMACKEAEVKRIVVYSTSEVYGTVYGNISEENPLKPQSTYAVSKVAADRLAFTLFHEHNVPVIILRQFNCYGPRETHEYVIPEIITQLDREKSLSLGNIKAKRDFMYVEDAAEAAVNLMSKGKVGEVYNLGTGDSISIENIAQIIMSEMKISPKIKIDKKRLRPFDVEMLKADTRKIKKVIGNPVKIKFLQGIIKTIKFYYENEKKWSFE